jgi:hypothetical protein
MTFEVERTETTTNARIGVHKFEMPAISDAEFASEPVSVFMGAITVADSALTSLEQVLGDPLLSPMGREQKAEPLRAEAIERVAAALGQVAKLEAAVNAREAALFSVPQIEATASAIAVEDREIRDWWRGQETVDRAKFISQVKENPEQHERLMIALMRAPAPLAMMDHEAIAVRELWRDAKRIKNPDVSAAIDADRRTIETVNRGLANLAAVARRSSGWEAKKVLRTIVGSKYEPARDAYHLFGFDSIQAAQARREVTAISAAR